MSSGRGDAEVITERVEGEKGFEMRLPRERGVVVAVEGSAEG